MIQGDGIVLSGDSKTTHKNARFCRQYRNRVVIPPRSTKAIVAQRGASVAIPHRYYQRRKKTMLTEQYRQQRYEMPASHSAVRRTLAGRGEPRTPCGEVPRPKGASAQSQRTESHCIGAMKQNTKRKQRRSKYAKTKQNDNYPLYQ